LSHLQRVCFRNFELDLTSGELHKDGQKVSLPPKAFGVLRSLVERPGEVVTREDLRSRLWAAYTFVEFDDSLNHAVKKLREALEDRADEPGYIETLPKYGYRFIADVAGADMTEAPVAEAGPARRILGKAAVVVAVLVAPYGILSYDLIASQRFDEARQAIEQAQARKLDDLVLRQVLYALAFLKNDPSAMEEQAAWFTGKAAVENSGLSLESDTAAYTGHLRRARELTGQSVDSAVRNGHKESAAIWQANAALREAGFGNTNESRRIAGEALKLLPTGQAVETEAALVLAMTGDQVRSASLAQDLSRRFPLDTQLQSLWLPTIQAQLALDKKEPTVALANLHVTAPVDRAAIQFLSNVSCLYPIYVRGEAYLAAGNGVVALTEFQKILDHNGIVWNCWTGALAHLGVARANALQARTSRGADADAARVRALGAYKDFRTLWEDADPDISILKEAKAEYAKLQF
jgi:DNA-binding winged helix-turn-helix (wHTH) protein